VVALGQCHNNRQFGARQLDDGIAHTLVCTPESKNPGAVALTSAMKKESRNSTDGIGAVWVGPLDNNAQVVHPLFNQGCFDSNRGVARYPKVRVYVRHE
jgi:hypothetical protein